MAPQARHVCDPQTKTCSSGMDSDADSAGAASAIDPGRPLVLVTRNDVVHPQSQEDWEERKEGIRHLYLERNLPLKEIRRIMYEEHSFSATERMFKRQFLKWNFRKYNTQGLRNDQYEGQPVEMPPGKTCKRPSRRGVSSRTPAQHLLRTGRPPLALVKTMAHANLTDRRTQELFVNLNDLIQGGSRNHAGWDLHLRFDFLPSPAIHLLEMFELFNRLPATLNRQRGAVLRRAFLILEDVITHDPVEMFRTVVLDAPYLIPSFDILSPYLVHFYRLLCVNKREGEPITRLARLMQQIMAGASEKELFWGIGRMHEHCLNYYGHVLGRKSELDQRDGVDVRCGEQGPAHRHTIECYNGVLTDAITQFGPAADEVITVEHNQVVATAFLDAEWDGFRELCGRHLDRLHAADEGPMEQWKSKSLERYAWVKYIASKLAVKLGDAEAGVECLKEAIRAAEYLEAQDNAWRESASCHVLRYQIEMEDVLRRIDRLEEARNVQASITSSKYLRDLVRRDMAENEAYR
ncbi:hypothetical protein CGCA056_v013304 [Colletotrichum aenigma]|uniref:uncharacterized protein n=1 Tax=Colletotrichum aenigma TaxID=1215731 RepID=UPI0018729202|nr:uncharacterized protein CGCA056_v013304 [Colletotrichum aenigma]KAF5507689.1 hypothetical protein CGCA056_v013304 [Colletotrichum aenigma]